MLTRLAGGIDAVNGAVGRFLGWAALLLIVLQFALVVANHVFSVGSIQAQEARLYINALIFLGAAGYTLLAGEHVRVDLFYRDADPRAKAWVDLIGTLVFLLPVIAILLWAGLPYVAAAWSIREGSTETGGLPFVYVLKSFILLFVATLGMQAVSVLIRSVTVIGRDRPAGPDQG